MSFCTYCYDTVSLTRKNNKKNNTSQLEIDTLLKKCDSMVETVSWNPPDDDSYKENHQYDMQTKSGGQGDVDRVFTSRRSSLDLPGDESTPPSAPTTAASRFAALFRRNSQTNNNATNTGINGMSFMTMISFTDSQHSGLFTSSRIEARSDPSFIGRTNSPGEREDIEDDIVLMYSQSPVDAQEIGRLQIQTMLQQRRQQQRWLLRRESSLTERVDDDEQIEDTDDETDEDTDEEEDEDLRIIEEEHRPLLS